MFCLCSLLLLGTIGITGPFDSVAPHLEQEAIGGKIEPQGPISLLTSPPHSEQYPIVSFILKAYYFLPGFLTAGTLAGDFVIVGFLAPLGALATAAFISLIGSFFDAAMIIFLYLFFVLLITTRTFISY